MKAWRMQSSPVIFIWQTRCTYSFLFSSVTRMLAPLGFRSLTSHTPNSWTCKKRDNKDIVYLSNSVCVCVRAPTHTSASQKSWNIEYLEKSIQELGRASKEEERRTGKDIFNCRILNIKPLLNQTQCQRSHSREHELDCCSEGRSTESKVLEVRC